QRLPRTRSASISISMVRLLRVTGVLLIMTGFGSLGSYFYIQLRYSDVMPREPDQSTGRVYPFNANRFHVFVTREAADRGRLAGIVAAFGVISVAVGTQLLHRAFARRG